MMFIDYSKNVVFCFSFAHRHTSLQNSFWGFTCLCKCFKELRWSDCAGRSLKISTPWSSLVLGRCSRNLSTQTRGLKDQALLGVQCSSPALEQQILPDLNIPTTSCLSPVIQYHILFTTTNLKLNSSAKITFFPVIHCEVLICVLSWEVV